MWDVTVYGKLKNLSNPNFNYVPDPKEVYIWLDHHYPRTVPDYLGKKEFLTHLEYYSGFTGMTKPELIPVEYRYWKEGVTNGVLEAETDCPENVLSLIYWQFFLSRKFPDNEFLLQFSSEFSVHLNEYSYFKFDITMIKGELINLTIDDPIAHALIKQQICEDDISEMLEERNGLYCVEEEIRFIISKINQYDQK